MGLLFVGFGLLFGMLLLCVWLMIVSVCCSNWLFGLDWFGVKVLRC